MGKEVQRHWPGVFTAQPLAGQRWRLSAADPPTEVYLRAPVVPFAPGARLESLVIDWRGDQAEVRTRVQGRDAHFMAASAIVHEPLPRLYEALTPLAYDPRTRRFWQRVFWVLRLPGGRWLLRLLAGAR